MSEFMSAFFAIVDGLSGLIALGASGVALWSLTKLRRHERRGLNVRTFKCQWHEHGVVDNGATCVCIRNLGTDSIDAALLDQRLRTEFEKALVQHSPDKLFVKLSSPEHTERMLKEFADWVAPRLRNKEPRLLMVLAGGDEKDGGMMTRPFALTSDELSQYLRTNLLFVSKRDGSERSPRIDVLIRVAHIINKRGDIKTLFTFGDSGEVVDNDGHMIARVVWPS